MRSRIAEIDEGGYVTSLDARLLDPVRGLDSCAVLGLWCVDTALHYTCSSREEGREEHSGNASECW